MQGVSSINPLDPLGVLDRTFGGFRVGCVALARALARGKEPPRYHVFGHIHEGRGVQRGASLGARRVSTTFINACSVNLLYRLRPRSGAPVVFDVMRR